MKMKISVGANGNTAEIARQYHIIDLMLDVPNDSISSRRGRRCFYKKELKDIAKVLDIPVSIMNIPLHAKQYKLIEKEVKQ